MTCRHEKRRWFMCYYMGSSKIEYLVSGFSEAHVRKHLRHPERRLRVKVAPWWVVMKVMSGSPYVAGSEESQAPQAFTMDGDDGSTLVRILA